MPYCFRDGAIRHGRGTWGANARGQAFRAPVGTGKAYCFRGGIVTAGGTLGPAGTVSGAAACGTGAEGWLLPPAGSGTGGVAADFAGLGSIGGWPAAGAGPGDVASDFDGRGTGAGGRVAGGGATGRGFGGAAGAGVAGRDEISGGSAGSPGSSTVSFSAAPFPLASVSSRSAYSCGCATGCVPSIKGSREQADPPSSSAAPQTSTVTTPGGGSKSRTSR